MKDVTMHEVETSEVLDILSQRDGFIPEDVKICRPRKRDYSTRALIVIDGKREIVYYSTDIKKVLKDKAKSIAGDRSFRVNIPSRSYGAIAYIEVINNKRYPSIEEVKMAIAIVLLFVLTFTIGTFF